MFSVALTVYSGGVTRVGQCRGMAFRRAKKEQRANTKKVFCPPLSELVYQFILFVTPSCGGHHVVIQCVARD